MKSKIIGAVIGLFLIIAVVAFAGENTQYQYNSVPWTLDTYLSGATTTGASSRVAVSHTGPVSNYTCLITFATATSNWVNLAFEGSIDGTNYYNLLTAPTISFGPTAAAWLSTGTYTAGSSKPALYSRMVYSQVSYSTLVGQGATAVTTKCLAY